MFWFTAYKNISTTKTLTSIVLVRTTAKTVAKSKPHTNVSFHSLHIHSPPKNYTNIYYKYKNNPTARLLAVKCLKHEFQVSLPAMNASVGVVLMRYEQ